MNGDADLAAVGGLLADRTRAAMLMTLLGGGLETASALASKAGVSRPLASHHLRKLLEGGLIVVETRGKQREFRLASQSIADALEGLIPLAPAVPVHSLKGAGERDRLRQGRMCYDHVAGAAGVGLVDGMVQRGMLAVDGSNFSVTAGGRQEFAAFGIDVGALAARPRPLARGCQDWSEGRAHLAGSLGAALSGELLRRGWLETREATRVVAVSPEGSRELQQWLGILLAPDAGCSRTSARLAA